MAETEKRLVAGEWLLGETLGKGGFGFVKLGYHKTNNKAFALKFINKREGKTPQSAQQNMLVATEINCLVKVQHPNVLKLFAYRTNCPYPTKDGGTTPTILLVLELACGGDLFDILYYTKKVDLNIARTYMHQLAHGLKAIHDAGICHRDLKPQNLLLNDAFELKICDFGLSKIFEADQKHVMKTYQAGTKGYQAPEQVLKRKFTPKCDLFACGVIMFIMLTGYPPCHDAHYADAFYKYIAAASYKKFWVKHRLTDVFDEETKSILNHLLCYQPSDRIDATGMCQEPFLESPKKLNKQQLRDQMKALFQKAMTAKSKDAAKIDKLKFASTINRNDRHVREFEGLREYPGDLSLLPRGRAFELRDGSSEGAHDLMAFLEKLCLTKKGRILFKDGGADGSHSKQFHATLKLCFETYESTVDEDGNEETVVRGVQERMAVVKIWKSVDGIVFAVFDFPNFLTQHEQEGDLYRIYAGEADAGSYPGWVEALDEENRDELFDGLTLHLQRTDGRLDEQYKQKLMQQFGQDAEDIELLAEMTPIEPLGEQFSVPSLYDFLLNYLGDHLKLEQPLEFKSELDADYDATTLELLRQFQECQ